MSVYQIAAGGRWRVQIRRRGFPRYDQLFDTEEQARRAETEQLGRITKATTSADLTLREAWTRYQQSSDFASKAARTRQTEAGRITAVLAELGEYSLANLQRDASAIYDYIDRRGKAISSRTKCKLSSTSVRLELAALSAVVAWAKRRRIVPDNFVRHIARPPQAKRRRRVEPVEQAKLQSAALMFDEPKLAEAARFVLLLRFLGCRPGELARLLRADVNLRSRDVTFRDTKYNGEDRRVHATNMTVELLDAQLQHAAESAPDSQFLFSTRRRPAGQPQERWTSFAYSTAVKRLRNAEAVGKDFHAHAMRREFISRAIEAGLPYATIRKQTGHHSSQAIEIYDEGLSTAPEIRAALDRHEESVRHEQLVGALQAMGISEARLEEVLRSLSGEPPAIVKRIRTETPKR